MFYLEEGGIRDLIECVVIANQPFELCGNSFAAGEPVLMIGPSKLSILKSGKNPIENRGGRGNRIQTYWLENNPPVFSINKGTLSPLSYALLYGARKNSTINPIVNITKKEVLTVNAGTVITSLIPITNSVYGYLGVDSQHMSEKLIVSNVDELTKTVEFKHSNNTSILDGTEITVVYKYEYITSGVNFEIGKDAFIGNFTLELKWDYKDYSNNGTVKTIIEIMPEAYLISSIAVTGGNLQDATDVNFTFVANVDKEGKYSNIYILDEDISD